MKLFVTAMVMCLFSASAIAGEFDIGTGAEYTEGDYGTGSDIQALYVPLTVGYTADKYGLSLTIPYLSVTGTGEVVYSRTGIRQSSQDSTTTSSQGPGSGSGSASSTSSVTDERTESGLGDVTLGATYNFLLDESKNPILAMTAKVKFATADENKNLGTGENDYSLQIEASMGKFYGYLGYLFIGDTELTDYNDILFGAVGVGAPIGSWRFGGEYYAEEAALDGLDPVSEATISAGRGWGKDKWLKLYLIKGFSDSSPDWGAGLGITRYF